MRMPFVGARERLLVAGRDHARIELHGGLLLCFVTTPGRGCGYRKWPLRESPAFTMRERLASDVGISLHLLPDTGALAGPTVDLVPCHTGMHLRTLLLLSVR
jgi:hypothetical protein